MQLIIAPDSKLPWSAPPYLAETTDLLEFRCEVLSILAECRQTIIVKANNILKTVGGAIAIAECSGSISMGSDD
ncbi:hypothetical protein [Halomicronema sp. CCY15110]|uniref:hypothetical protein n=1 Tax=Halomicronema sp. CCY15110 TaxID=2767773 RepID=UPI00194DAF96|nr:hypothetical protein [Halomicronema sp. CCY15110]